MEYVPCGTLTRKLKEPFSVVAAAFYSAQIALALMHLHSLGILYRDLKPDNLVLTEWKYLKLCDFGSCCPGCKGQKTVKVGTGTPRYWSPEKFRHLPYGRPADWWSLGIILYQMLMAKLPFTADESGFDAYGDAVTNMEVDFSPNLPADAVGACRAFLDKDPEKRLGGPEEGTSVFRHAFYRQKVNWAALQQMRVRPPPMYARRHASVPAYMP